VEPTEADVLAILDANARMPRPTGPVTLRPAYLRAVERWEQLPENAPRSDKSWVARSQRAWHAHFASARLVSR